ncbi:hypothetical protein NUACC21_11500 [Scytonema sp. NUACC21]
METNLRLASIILLAVGAYLTVPKIAVAFTTLNAPGASTTAARSSTNSVSESQTLESAVSSTAVSNNYEPPNYGGPDSQHGSGTR